jgi:hypothetical protein
MGLVECLIAIAHAQRVVIHVRIDTHDLLARSPYRVRIPTQFIGNVKMGGKKKICNHELDNRLVVPYNPYLLWLFNCHINVEACGSIKAIKHMFKYIYKGHDRASVAMREANNVNNEGNIDEIKSIEMLGG